MISCKEQKKRTELEKTTHNVQMYSCRSHCLCVGDTQLFESYFSMRVFVETYINFRSRVCDQPSSFSFSHITATLVLLLDTSHSHITANDSCCCQKSHLVWCRRRQWRQLKWQLDRNVGKVFSNPTPPAITAKTGTSNDFVYRFRNTPALELELEGSSHLFISK